MPTPISHGIFGAAIGAIAARVVPELPVWQAVATGALSAALPDIDVVFELRHAIVAKSSRYRVFTHRGITHSLFVAPLLVMLMRWFDTSGPLSAVVFWGYQSHLLLDLFNGRDGVALLLPFTRRRYRFRWRPIRSIPLSTRVLQPSYLGKVSAGVASEVAWIWSCAAILAALTYVF